MSAPSSPPTWAGPSSSDVRGRHGTARREPQACPESRDRSHRPQLFEIVDIDPPQSLCASEYSGSWWTFVHRACFPLSEDRLRKGRSPPSRGRGSKLRKLQGTSLVEWSPPSRGRGSKLMETPRALVATEVAPFAGAWIETFRWRLHAQSVSCRPLRGGVDRNDRYLKHTIAGKLSPPSRGRGSKRHARLVRRVVQDVAPFAGAWIETHP